MGEVKQLKNIKISLVVFFCVYFVVSASGVVGPEVACQHGRKIEMVVALTLPYGPQYVIITLPEGFLNDAQSKGLLWWFEDENPLFIKPDGTIDMEKWVIERGKKDAKKLKREKGI